jgi:hypothetical protein
MTGNGKTELMHRCLEELKNTMPLDARIKILRVLASTATKMADEFETYFEPNETA